MFDVLSALPRVHAENIRVPRSEFGAAWGRAEQIADATDPDDGYTTGLVLAFRWLAGYSPHSPVTRRVILAMPETIGPELIAANTMVGQPGHHSSRVDIARSTAAVLSWVWEHGPLPLLLTEQGHRASTGSST